MKIVKGFLILCLIIFAGSVNAKPVVADLTLLEEAGITAVASHSETGIGYANITSEEESRLQLLAHQHGKCGGFEALPVPHLDAKNPILTELFSQLAVQNEKNRRFYPNASHYNFVTVQSEIETALSEVSADNLRKTVEFLSKFEDRTYSSSNPNQHVEALKTELEAMTKNSSFPIQIELVKHRSIGQKSIRIRLEGSNRPNEIIILGGHLDSINQSWGGSELAPGADDNASGSANLIEALRILLTKKQPERTLEFFLYAGEEGGLIGSAEIASEYKKAKKDVIAVLQLDMTLFPGSGKFVLGSMTDFTSSWLRGYLESVNTLYIKAKIVDDKCGYGCSDHASWYRQGFPTLMPFEATFKGSNKNIHSSRDVIDANSNFEHSAMFTKIALILAMDLGNSTAREPK